MLLRIQKGIELKGDFIMTRTYTNDTNEYQLVGNCKDVICQGSEEACIAKMESIKVECSKWGALEVVPPYTKTWGRFVEGIKLEESENLIDELNWGK
jgi:hypothetical protein